MEIFALFVAKVVIVGCIAILTLVCLQKVVGWGLWFCAWALCRLSGGNWQAIKNEVESEYHSTPKFYRVKVFGKSFLISRRKD